MTQNKGKKDRAGHRLTYSYRSKMGNGFKTLNRITRDLMQVGKSVSRWPGSAVDGQLQRIFLLAALEFKFKFGLDSPSNEGHI